MYDPDAPTGSGFWHWLIFDIPSNTTELAANVGNIKLNIAPKGAIQSITDYGIKRFWRTMSTKKVTDFTSTL